MKAASMTAFNSQNPIGPSNNVAVLSMCWLCWAMEEMSPPKKKALGTGRSRACEQDPFVVGRMKGHCLASRARHGEYWPLGIIHKLHTALDHESLACMQWKRVKWCSLKFLTTDRNSRKKMMSGANWLL